jgi:TPR repeat protein
LKNDLNSNNKQARNKAWRRLNQLSKTKNSYQAKTMLTNFVKQTFNLAQSSNKNYQKQAFERLNLIASSGDKTALRTLGQAYSQGIGTEKNWGKSWRQLKQANATQEKNRLEIRADSILHNEKSTQKQRNLAYQAAEITARNEPEGDPAQKWMAHRYEIGDGVPVNKAKAQWWQDVYDGKRKLTPMVGEQW